MKNFFIILEWDPTDLNREKLRLHIDRKESDWNKATNGGGPAAKEARYYRELLPQIRALLFEHKWEGKPDEDKFQEEVEDAKKFLVARRTRNEERLLHLIRLAESRGFITQEQFQDLKKKVGMDFSEEEIRKNISLPIQENSAKKEDEVPKVWITREIEIAEDLEAIGAKDLYDFLSTPEKPCTRRTSGLHEIAADIYSRMQRISKKTAQVEARTKLAGHAREIFDPKNEKSRQLYEKALERKRLKFLDEEITFAATGDTLEPAGYEMLLKSGMQTGASREKVESYITSIAKDKRLALFKPLSSGVDAMISCPACGVLNEKTAEFCKTCAEPYCRQCPKCGASTEVSSRMCTSCSFELGNMRWVTAHLEKARALVLEGKDAEADTELKRAEIFWPNHREAKELREAIESKAERKSAEIQSIQILLDKGKLWEAQLKVKNCDPADARTREMVSEIARRGKHAQKFLELVWKHISDKNESEALRALEELHEIANDLPEIPRVAASLAPAEPAAATAIPLNSAILLKWMANTNRSISYIVFRRNITLKDTHGQTALAKTSENNYLDANVIPGNVYEYLVYSERAGIRSKRMATTSPVLAIAEVCDLHATLGNGLVTLSWKLPDGTGLRAIVRFQEGGIPASMQEGTVLAGVTRDNATAVKLANGKTYGFRVGVVFRGPDGSEVTTHGVEISATPEVPPERIAKLSLSYSHGRVEAKWPAPANGRPALLFAEKGIVPEPHALITAGDVSQYGRLIPINSIDQAVFEPPAHGLLTFVMLTFQGDVAVVGGLERVTVQEERVAFREIHFEASIKGLFKKELQIEIFSKDKPARGPEFILLKSRDMIPVNSSEGSLVETIPSQAIGPVPVKKCIPLSAFNPGEYFNLLLADPALAKHFRILKPNLKSLRIPN